MQLIYTLLIFSALYAFAMKFADLLDEHGLHLFKGDAFIFGLLWGIFGSYIIYLDANMGNIILAMNIAFLIRGSLDYINHRLAAAMIIISFALFSVINLPLFFSSLLVFVIFGILEDKSDKLSKKNKAIGTLCDIMLYYPIFGLAYYLIYQNLVVFFSLTIFTIVYGITKHSARKFGYK